MHPNVHNTNISLPHPIITYRSSYTQHADKACQTSKLAHKYHYGLFKTQSCLDKKIKSKLIYLSNLFRSDLIEPKPYTSIKPKITFSKRLNKFFFRAGRNTLLNLYSIKKYCIQRYTTKKIFSFVKHPLTNNLNLNTIVDTLIQVNLFYSYNDSYRFIKTFGVLVDRQLVYNPSYQVTRTTTFSLVVSFIILNFLQKLKSKVIKQFKKIKFYKYRSKLYTTWNDYKWVSNKDWLLEYAFICTNRTSSVEFDWKTFSGVVLTSDELLNLKPSKLSDLSLYMGRSYIWKYIT